MQYMYNWYGRAYTEPVACSYTVTAAAAAAAVQHRWLTSLKNRRRRVELCRYKRALRRHN